jgi:N-acetylmuramoyl-L-alanine amidase
LDRGRWKSIVIHASGSPVGNPASISAGQKAMHLSGLGYQFVIGNGRGMDDGELHVGYRWLDQLSGAHAAGPQADWYNDHSIGICLVGNGDRQPFTDAQVRRLVRLVQTLARELDIPQDRILLHSDLVRADDPGRFFPAAAFREQLAAASGR